MNCRSAILVATALLFCASICAAQDPAEDPPAVAPSLEEVQAELKKAKEALAAVEADDLEKATGLLDGAPITGEERDLWLEALKARASVLRTLAERRAPRDKSELEARLSSLEAESTTLSETPAEKPGLDVTEDDLTAQMVPMEKLKQEEQSATEALDGIGKERDAANADLADLPGEIAKIEKGLGEDVGEGDLPSYKRRTRVLELHGAKLSLEDARTFVAAIDVLTQVRKKEVELAGERLARLAGYMEAIQTILEKRNRLDQEAQEAEAKRLREAAERESDPVVRYEKRIEARITGIRADTGTDKTWLTRVTTLKNFQAARNELLLDLQKRLQSRFQDDRRVSARSADQLLTTRRRIEEWRDRLQSVLRPELETEFEAYREQFAEMQDTLWELEEPIDDDTEGYRELLGQLPEERQDEAITAFAAKRADLKSELYKREGADFGAIYAELAAIEDIYDAREDLLETLYTEIFKKIIWMQSDPPLGPDMLGDIRAEALDVAITLGGRRARAELKREMSGKTERILLVLAGIVGLIVAGLLLFFRLKTHEVGRATRGGRFLGLLQRFLTALVISAVAPLCLVAASLLLGLLNLPETHDRLGRSLLVGLAIILFVRRFSRALFRPNGIVVEDLMGPPEVARQLFKFFRWGTAGLIFLWLPWWLLKSRVFTLTDLPRLIYTVMLAFFALLLIGLVKPRGAVVRHMSGEKGFWYRTWRMIYPIVALGMLAIVVMDALGYRAGASLLTEKVAQTFAAAFILFGLYHVITAVFRQALPKLGTRWWAEESGESTAQLSDQMLARTTKFAGLTAVVIGIVLLATFWGFNQQAKSLAESVHITTVDAEKGIHLTLWNVIIALAWIVGAHFVVRNLGAFYQATLFTRLEASDPGSRYVIVAISKYLILLIGYSAAVLGLHISFSSLGWILAAASVGLGFGLQEIVSNFVSGLILFVERPIKVGDFVTVGTTLGTVERINIRATQVISRDRKVIIIPNRLFISEQVVNWSHNDNLVRTRILVGVAYGTDVKKARDVLLDIVGKHPLVRRTPPPRALLLTFGASSLDIELRIFTDIVDRRRVENEVNTEIAQRFAEEGIEIPFPQQDLHIRTGSDKDLLDALHDVAKDETEEKKEQTGGS